jgi:hypothetical protein
MEPASTFTHKIIELLQAVSCQLFFTGHCLRGWLQQVTNFTTEYRKTERNTWSFNKVRELATVC